MLYNLLAGTNWSMIVLSILIIGALVVFWFLGRRAQQKREEQINATLNAMQPGNKVQTIGGICGVVVEICPEDDTFILETGSETTGKSYIKLLKKAVYQTDAAPVAPVAEVPAEEAPVEEKTEAPFEEVTEEAPATEVPVEEAEKKDE